jgi:hypothetical protein
VDQGRVGNCYFAAALGAVALRSPSTIYNMFAANPDGTFTVRFFRDGMAAYVTVNRYLPANSDGYAVFAGWGGPYNAYYQGNNELWVALAEKAYAQLNESGWIGQDGTNTYAGIAAGQPSNAFNHLTGKTAEDRTSSGYALISDWNAGKAITLASKSSVVATQVVANHAYTLVGYNPDTKRFRLYNPWGSNADGDQPAVLNLTWSQIVGNFERWTSVLL